MKLKNINRGLALGAVLILGTAFYAVNASLRFKKNIPDIQSAAEESVEAMVLSNVSEPDNAVGHWRNFVSEYMTDYNAPESAFDYAYTKKDVLQEINNQANGNFIFDSYGEITAAAFDLTNIEVKKFGKNGASVSISYSAYYEYTGVSPIYLDFYGLSTLVEFYDEYDVTEELLTQKNCCTLEGEAQLYMVNTSDGWKIAAMDLENLCEINDALEASITADSSDSTADAKEEGENE